MEFLKIVRRRSFLSEVVYTALNVALAIALLLIIRSTESIWFAFGLILLSKWRVLAVRPRYWFVNIQANLVDVIVSVSTVIFLYASSVTVATDEQKLGLEVVLTLLYIGWLLFLKPRSKRAYVIAQAAVGLFVGVAAIYMIGYNWPASLAVLLMWVIGYGTARHVLSSYEEPHIVTLSLMWGLALGEIGWLAYHWTIAYRLPILQNFLLPQVSLIVLCFGFLAQKSYDSYFHHQRIRLNDILLPLLFTISIVAVLLFVFDGVNTSNI